MIFGWWIYLSTIFIAIPLRGMKAFPLNFVVGRGVLLTDSFQRFSSEKPGGLHEILVCGGSPHGEIGWRSLYFVLSFFIYLFLICLFIACLCICFLITLREQLCGLAPWGAISVFWWVSSGLICSPVDLMQDVMKSLPSFLIYCYYCLFYC